MAGRKLTTEGMRRDAAVIAELRRAWPQPLTARELAERCGNMDDGQARTSAERLCGPDGPARRQTVGQGVRYTLTVDEATAVERRRQLRLVPDG